MTNKNAIDKKIAAKVPSLKKDEITAATSSILTYISDSLIKGRRIEIRNFGSFSLRTKNVFLAGSQDKQSRLTRTVYFRMSKNFI